MSRRAHLVIAGVVLVVGLVLTSVLVMRAGSPEAWIEDHYRRVSHNSATDSSVYSSGQPPSQTVEALTSSWEPYQRLNDPVGYFLRYSDVIVRVSAHQGGSRIRVEDDERGYHVWAPFIGGWGTYRGPGESFRGGGPGAGK